MKGEELSRPGDLLAAARPAGAHAEEAALAVKGVTNSEGAQVGWSRAAFVLVGSNGFLGCYDRTAPAGAGMGTERDYDYSSTVHLSDL